MKGNTYFQNSYEQFQKYLLTSYSNHSLQKWSLKIKFQKHYLCLVTNIILNGAYSSDC